MPYWRIIRRAKNSSDRDAQLKIPVSIAAVLYGFWLVLSGHFEPFLLAAGVVCAVAVTIFMRSMSVVDREAHPVDLLRRAIVYWPWLLKEIAKSAWDVTKLIVDPRLPISPTLITVKASQKTDIGVATYANSITLTPGTISVEVERGEILVHALTKAGADSLAEGDMDRRVTTFEGRS